MNDPASWLAIVMAVLLIAYALLGGADFGGGVWDLLASGRSADRQRATIERAIAPVWEANHVWLIVVVTILFNAFPPAFARLSTSLHVPLSLLLLGIVLRGSAFVFRAYGPARSPSLRAFGWVFATASVLAPLMLGVIVGAISEGRLGATDAGAAPVAAWLSPFSASVGALALSTFAYLAAVYLTLEAREPATADAFRSRALFAGVATAALALLVAALAGDAPHVVAALTDSPWSWPLGVATASAAAASFALLWRRRFAWARVAAAAQVALIVGGFALAQHPYLIRPDLTIAASAAPRHVLVLLLSILACGAIVLLPALLYLFHIFAPRDRERDAA